MDPSNVETHFALLKRTAKKNRVEFFRVTSGPRKTDNALKLLNVALHNIKINQTARTELENTTVGFFLITYLSIIFTPTPRQY